MTVTGCSATVSEVVKHLGNISKASASRRVNVALKNGWLVNSENIKGKPYKLEIGEPLPDETALPTPDSLGDCSTVSHDFGGYEGAIVDDDGRLIAAPAQA